MDTSKTLTVPEARQALGLSPDGPATMSVPAAGALAYGLSRNSSYEAADRGDIPTENVGRLRKALIVALAMKLLK